MPALENAIDVGIMSQITIACPASVRSLMSHRHRQPILCLRWRMKLEANLAGFPPHKRQIISQHFLLSVTLSRTCWMLARSSSSRSARKTRA